MTLHEFEIIERYFKTQPVHRNEVILGIGDDAAIIEPPLGQQIVITMDTLIAGTHFPLDTSPFDIGLKALAVNLSDLAAMGATPDFMTLALTLPSADERWLTEFCRGLFELTQRYHIQLIGGDLTRGSLSITICAYGSVVKNQALRRDTAKPGDLIYVSNTLGDAAAGLKILQDNLSLKDATYFVDKLNRPQPRIDLGKALLGIAHAAIDISDGLAADLGHILKSSRVGAVVHVAELPLSRQLRESFSMTEALEFALNGGDDYELCVTVPTEKRHLLSDKYTCIGHITERSGLDLRTKEGNPYTSTTHGYHHF